MRLIDLSHSIENDLVTYKGLPAPLICDYLSREESRKFYEEGTEFAISKIEMVGNTGTYIDCPFHRYPDGSDFSELEISRFAELDALVFRIDYQKHLSIEEELFKGYDLKGKAILLHTGWAERWNSPHYFENHPFLSAEAAEYLKNQGVVLVGIDSHNIDDTRKNSRPAHSILLRNNILIAEHLCCLEALPDQDFTFNAVPPKFKGVGTFPVRAFAKIAD